MTVTDIEARTEEFTIGENRMTLYSHLSLTTPGEHIIQLFVGQTEIVMAAPTRGDAMVELAEFLKDVAMKIRMMAFQQEGALSVEIGELLGSRLGRVRG